MVSDSISVLDLSEETEGDYLTCMEEWSEDMKDGLCRKTCWTQKMLAKGLRVKLARNEQGVVAGMIHYAPIEYSWAEGEDLYFVYCIWVHGHKQGRGDLRGQGVGTALLLAAEEDARGLGTQGLVTWGLLLPFFMRAGWFKKHGYQKVDSKDMVHLMWKPFTENAVAPRWIKSPKKKPDLVPGKVVVTALANGWCTGINGMIERTQRICQELGDKVVYREVDVSNQETLHQWGQPSGLFIDKKNIYNGPPLSEKKIMRAIEKKISRL